MPGERPPTAKDALRALGVDVPGDRPPSASASEAAEALGLGVIATREGLSVADQVALRDADLRAWMAKDVIPVFLKANGLALIAIGVLVVLDEINIATSLMAPRDRIIGGQVIIALLGATAVQVGAIAAIIARYLFPGRPS